MVHTDSESQYRECGTSAHSRLRVYTASKLAKFGLDSPDEIGGYIYTHLKFVDIIYPI
jgi:hypothetical protein